MVLGGQAGGTVAQPPVIVPHTTTTTVRQLHEAHAWGCLNMGSIPGILALTDCIMGLASGMTIKFFPIFFREEVSLSPMYVNLMYCAVPFFLSCAAALAQRQSQFIGKVQTMVFNRAIGIALLYWIALHVELWGQGAIMVPVYVVRTSIMNANYPIQRALLMDYVSKEHRAKWNSLECVTSFGWSGSAAVGGWLINTYGFQFTFLVTATMQLVGWMCSMLLLPIVPWRDLTPGMVAPSVTGTHASSRRGTGGGVLSRRSTGGGVSAGRGTGARVSGGGGVGPRGGGVRRQARRAARR